MSTIAEYLESLRGKSVAVIGMGVSNTPLIRMMLRAGLKVTVCDKSPRERVEELAAELEARVRAHLMEVQNSRIKQPAAPAKPVDVSADDFDAE